MKSFALAKSNSNRFKLMLRFSNWLNQFIAKLVPAPFRLIQMGAAYWQSRLLLLATQLDLASLLDQQALSVAQLAQQANVEPGYLQRLLDYFIAHQIFTKSAQGLISNNHISDYLNRHNDDNIRDMILLHQSAAVMNAWDNGLAEGFHQGRPPFAVANGEDFYSYMRNNAGYNQLFNSAMNSVNSLAGEHYAKEFDWGFFRRLIDIGGSMGSKSAVILKHHSKLEALVVDHEAVISTVQAEQLYSPSVSPRMAFATGDLFGQLPAIQQQDVCLLSAVLHSYNDKQCLAALANIYQHAQCSQPWLVIAEMQVASPIDRNAAVFDMQMLISCDGVERSNQQWQLLISQSDFVLVETVNTQSLASLIVLRGKAKTM